LQYYFLVPWLHTKQGMHLEKKRGCVCE
jgi:hypothetical protein